MPKRQVLCRQPGEVGRSGGGRRGAGNCHQGAAACLARAGAENPVLSTQGLSHPPPRPSCADQATPPPLTPHNPTPVCTQTLTSPGPQHMGAVPSHRGQSQPLRCIMGGHPHQSLKVASLPTAPPDHAAADEGEQAEDPGAHGRQPDVLPLSCCAPGGRAPAQPRQEHPAGGAAGPPVHD